MQDALDLALAQPSASHSCSPPSGRWRPSASSRTRPPPHPRRRERQQESLDSLASTVETVLETARQTNATSELTLGMVRGVDVAIWGGQT